MTPKEKAKELVYKYENLVTTWNCYFDTEIPISDRLPEMKICALICVDEMINYHNSLFDKGFKNVHQDLKTPNKLYSDIMNKELLYLQEVKQEIEKL